MNRTQFLAALAKTPREWRLTAGVLIRLDETQCPITALASPPESSSTASAVAERLNIDHNLCGRICAAADKAGRYSHKLRAELLKACGLAEDDAK